MIFFIVKYFKKIFLERHTPPAELPSEFVSHDPEKDGRSPHAARPPVRFGRSPSKDHEVPRSVRKEPRKVLQNLFPVPVRFPVFRKKNPLYSALRSTGNRFPIEFQSPLPRRLSGLRRTQAFNPGSQPNRPRSASPGECTRNRRFFSPTIVDFPRGFRIIGNRAVSRGRKAAGAERIVS